MSTTLFNIRGYTDEKICEIIPFPAKQSKKRRKLKKFPLKFESLCRRRIATPPLSGFK
jgi:hypothetical protein